MEDQIVAVEMATKAFCKLHEVEPEHELVKIMTEGEDDEFVKKFWDKDEDYNKLPGSMVSMYVQTKYFVAVKKVLKEKYNIEI